jgi:hypothetical protein
MPGAQGPGTEGGGRRLLGLVQRMIQTGMAMARGVNLIARQRLAGQDLSLLGPAGFNPTLASALVVQAVAWTAALRERLMVMAVRPPFTRGLPRPDRAPQGRSAPFCPPENLAEPTAQDWHNWQELARPWRMGPGGVAVATRAIAGMPDREVVAQICGKLSQAAAELGAEADVARIVPSIPAGPRVGRTFGMSDRRRTGRRPGWGVIGRRRRRIDSGRRTFEAFGNRGLRRAFAVQGRGVGVYDWRRSRIALARCGLRIWGL